MIDLFAGCGGLTEGFLQTGLYTEIAAVEWLKPQVNTLRKRLKDKWGISDVESHVMHFDIQREAELFSGWNDPEYGIILITEKLMKRCPEIIYDFKLNRKRPLIVEIPDRHGTSNISDTITQYIYEAIGIQI